MALNVQKGVITEPGSTGNQTYSLPSSFNPQALILWSSFQTSETETAPFIYSFGMATYDAGAVQHNYVGAGSQDNVGTSAVLRASFNDRLGAYVSDFSTGSMVGRVDFVSFQTGATSDFVLNWVSLSGLSSPKWHYIVLGGGDITDARAGSFTLNTSTPQDVTVVAGFGQPDLVLFTSASAAANSFNIGGSGQIGLGIAKSDTVRQATFWTEQDAQTTSNIGLWQKARALVGMGNAATADFEFDLDTKASWPTDGFRLAIPDLPGLSSEQVLYLALKGTFRSALGVNTCPTSGAPNTQNNDATFPPKLGMVWGGNIAANASVDNTHADLGQFYVGATDGTNEGWAAGSSDDGVTTTQTLAYHSESKTIRMHTPVTPTLDAEADGSFSGNNFVLTWNDVGGVAREYNWLALGNAAGAQTISMSGAITPTGGLAKKIAKPVAGTITPSGGIFKKVAKSFAGTITPDGTPTLLKKQLLALAGTIAPTGDIAKKTGKFLVGTVTPAGSLVNKTAKALAGTITPAGALTALQKKAIILAGSIAPAGALVFKTSKSLAGSITPSGVLSKKIGKALAGVITPAGALGQIYFKALALVGAIAPSGALRLKLSKPFAGSITPSGALMRKTGKGFSGTLTMAGALVRKTGKALSGVLSPIGTLTRKIRKFFGETITPIGDLDTSAFKVVRLLDARAADDCEFGFQIYETTGDEITEAKAGGASWVRFQPAWTNIENYATGVFTMSAEHRAWLSACRSEGMNVWLVAAYGPPWTQLTTLTVAAPGAALGDTVIPVTTTAAAITWPYDYVLKHSDGTNITARGPSAYYGALIASGSATNITLAHPTNVAVPTGTVLRINRLKYPPPNSSDPDDPSIQAYMRYVLFLANSISQAGCGGAVELWNEPPWTDDYWSVMNRFYPSGSIPGNVYLGGGCVEHFCDAALDLARSQIPPGVEIANGGTNKSGSCTYLATVPPSPASKALNVKYQGFHAYAYDRSAETHQYSYAAGVATNLPGSWPTSNLPYLYGFHYTFAQANPTIKVQNMLSETGILTPDEPARSRFLIRHLLSWWGLDWNPIILFMLKFYFADNFEIMGKPAYSSLANLSSMLRSLGEAAANPQYCTITSWPVTGWEGYVSRLGGVHGSMTTLWQRTWVPQTTDQAWVQMARPAAINAVLTVPTNATITVQNLATREAISYTRIGNSITVPVADDPIAILARYPAPIAASTATPSLTARSSDSLVLTTPTTGSLTLVPTN